MDFMEYMDHYRVSELIHVNQNHEFKFISFLTSLIFS
jgi:hypothetical protein